MNCCKKLIQLLLLFVFVTLTGFSQETDGKVNLNWDHQRHSWESTWINHPSASVFDYGVFNFRRKFWLEEVYDSSTVYVSADNRYRLYVNGAEVSHGPARSTLEYWNYETVDITPFLKKGENIIAAEVFNLGEHRPVAQFSAKTAFILQGKDYLGEKINTGQQGWLVSQNKAFKAIPVTRQMVRHFYVAGPCDLIDGSLYPWGWQSLNFDDSKWQNPGNLERGAGRGYLHGVNWHLVPRNIPHLEQKITRFDKIARSEGALVHAGFLKNEKALEIPAHSKVKMLLDHKVLTVGYPELTVSAGKNSSVKVIYSEALYDENGKKGNRNHIDGKEIEGYYDIFLPDGGEMRTFKPLWIRTFRYVQLEIETKEEPLVLNNYHSIFTVYPFVEEAGFASDNPRLQDIWDMSWRAARLCAGETYMDCPFWEQLQYIGDTRIQALISLYVSGDDRLMKNAILQADQSRIPEGLTTARGPTNVIQVIPPFSLYWIEMVHDFYMHRNDREYVRQFLPGMHSVLGWFEQRIDESGMLGPLDWYNFCDWTEGFMVGTPAGVDTSNSALISLQFAHTLDKASELFWFYGKDCEAQRYTSLASDIKKAVFERCYDPVKKLLKDTPYEQIYSQHTNILGILSNAFPKDDQPEVMQKILYDTSLIQTTIYFRFYLFQAMQKAGLANEYLSQLDPWYDMLDDGLTTTVEGEDKERSDCHAWGASPNYDFLATVCGIRPMKPGFAEVKIEPALGNLNFIKGHMPHPNGEISVDLAKEGENGLKGSVTLPPVTKGMFIWQNSEMKLGSGTTLIELKL
ncbi:alpha-L-rhamnosidase N-terminal domain-containing protein [Mariniphaga sp.]|uniref:alpha-L-rhamnosidase-related protein n=1 Tax=Mariniphaga sp. TaxID=1954475 RepID=UPI003562850A